MVTMDTTRSSAEVRTDAAPAALAWWSTAPGSGEFRTEPLPPVRDGDALVRTLWTGISRGTETLVARGDVPDSERDRMRAPFQEGDFPFPVKYGYLNVGLVEVGPAPLRGRTVFSLHPHQSRFVAPAEALTPVPESVPARRATLAGAVETAVNILWDARPLVGDRVVVIGAGLIGGAVATLARAIPGAEVTLVDVDPAASALADGLGVRFAEASAAPGEADVVIECSGHPDGLRLGLRIAPTDGEVVVASWFGAKPVPLELGADFHSRRLSIRASQVGAVSTSRRAERTTRDRLALALRLLEDPGFDLLLGGTSPRADLPRIMAALADGTADPLCHTIDWRAE